jgi:DNA-binding response OmpR family regulator
MPAVDKVKLLLVEDDKLTRQFMETVLKGEGYEVSCAVDGSEGVVMTRKVLPHLIVTDVAMPSMSGFEMCQRLRRDPHTQRIPIIFVTGCLTPEDYRIGFSLGADDYLAKPLRPAELISRVQAALQRIGINAPEVVATLAQPAPVAPPVEHVLLAGRLSTATVPDLLQTLGFNNVSGTLVVRAEHEGRVELRRGELIRAEVRLPRKTLQGSKAWLRLASWTQGSFQLLDSAGGDGIAAAPARNIQLSTPGLLMEAAVNREEVRSLRAKFPATGVELRQGRESAKSGNALERAILAGVESGIRLDDLLDDLDFPDREILQAVLKLIQAGRIEATPVRAARET